MNIEKNFKENMKREQQDKIEKYKVLNTLAKKGQILFTGLSLMEQFPINELLMTESMDQIIYNRGVGGFTTDDMGEWAKTLFVNRNNQNIPVANAEIKKLAETFGFRYIDVNAGLTDECGKLKKEYTVEGVHMYANAYRIILENMRPYL